MVECHEYARKGAQSSNLDLKLLIIKTLWRCEQDSNWWYPYKAKIRESPPEFEPTFACFADGEFSRYFAEDSPLSNQRLLGKSALDLPHQPLNLCGL